MADVILNRKISVDTYPFPEGSFKIYGSGKFYNGFSIGESSNISVVNKDGVLKFSGVARNAKVILGTMPKNNKTSIYIDIASPLPRSDIRSAFNIGGSVIGTIKAWTTAGITYTNTGPNTNKVQAGGVLAIEFWSSADLPEIQDLFAVRALWAL